MKRRRLYVLGACAMGIVAASAIGYQTLNKPVCSTPLMHLPNAGEHVCLETSISSVYLTFDRPVRVKKFAEVVSTIRGIDFETSRQSDDARMFRLVFYMSRTDIPTFVMNIAARIDDPALFQK